LPESACTPAVVVGKVGGGSGRRNRDVDLRVVFGPALAGGEHLRRRRHPR
jgi:hypothetical protein